MKAIILVSFVFILLLTSGCVQQTQKQASEKATVSLKYTDAKGTTILEKSFKVAKGTNAFDAIKENVALGYKMYNAGAFVESIGGIKPPKGYYLALYINGKYADKGISSQVIEKDTIIEWKTESIESFPSQ